MVKKAVVEGKRAYFDTGVAAHCHREIKQFLTEVFTGCFGCREMLQTGFDDEPQTFQLTGRAQRHGSAAGTLFTQEAAVRDTEGGYLQTAAVHALIDIQGNTEEIHQFGKITCQNKIRILLFI